MINDEILLIQESASSLTVSLDTFGNKTDIFQGVFFSIDRLKNTFKQVYLTRSTINDADCCFALQIDAYIIFRSQCWLNSMWLSVITSNKMKVILL